MPKVSAHDAALTVLATALVFVVLFWRLGTPTFWDPDEAHYAETTREMIASAERPTACPKCGGAAHD